MIFKVLRQKIYDFIRQKQIKRFIRIRRKIGFSDKIKKLKKKMQSSATSRASFAEKDIVATSTFGKFLPFWERYLYLLEEKYTSGFKHKKIVPCSLKWKDYYRRFAFEGCMLFIPKIAEQDVIKCSCCKSGDFVIIRTNICEERFMGWGMSLNKVRQLFVVCLDCGYLIDSYWVMDNEGLIP